jgi:hypothetical protein
VIPKGFGHGSLGEALNDLDGGLDPFLSAFLNHVVPAATGWIGKHTGIAGEETGEKAHIVRVIGNH